MDLTYGNMPAPPRSRAAVERCRAEHSRDSLGQIFEAMEP
jgi:hypothetical protein